MKFPCASGVTIKAYEDRMRNARDKFEAGHALRLILSPNIRCEVMEAFLIHFSAFGVGMTELVEGWIRRAGERCAAMSLERLGTQLIGHSRHEAGHHQMMIDDTQLLVARWNACHAVQIYAGELLARPPTPGVQSYRALHERVIEATPYGQLAIEYEIEALSVRYGNDLLKNAAGLMGAEVVQRLSFVREHVIADRGHTKFNALHAVACCMRADGAQAFGVRMEASWTRARSISVPIMCWLTRTIGWSAAGACCRCRAQSRA